VVFSPEIVVAYMSEGEAKEEQASPEPEVTVLRSGKKVERKVEKEVEEDPEREGNHGSSPEATTEKEIVEDADQPDSKQNGEEADHVKGEQVVEASNGAVEESDKPRCETFVHAKFHSKLLSSKAEFGV